MRTLLMLTLVIAAACGQTGAPDPAPAPAAGAPIPGGGLTVSEAIASDLPGPLMVRGEIVAREGDAPRLCEALAESYPPQCAGASVAVRGLDLRSVEGVQTVDGVSWGPASLLGEVGDGVLTVSPTSLG